MAYVVLLMVHWVYVVECEDDYLYIGETTRLFRRFREHLNGRGGSNTIKHKPYKLIGLYKVNDNDSFIQYRDTIKSGEYSKDIIDNWGNCGDNLLIENHITQRFLYERRDNDSYGGGLEWYKVRGGKYTRESLDSIVSGYKWASEQEGRTFSTVNPIDSIPKDTIIDRPLCKCHSPSEVKISKDKSKIYFVCALKNVWDGFCSDLEIDDPCDFWQLYIEDRKVKEDYEVIKARTSESWILNVPFTKSQVFPDPCVSCNKSEYFALFKNGRRSLCKKCLLTKYDILKEKYNVCMISDE